MTLELGGSETDIAMSLLTSAEFNASHPSDAAFVTGLFRSVLGHGLDGTAQGWEQALASGTSRATVAQAFLTSPELRQEVIDQDYANLLHRPPSPLEDQMWMTFLQLGMPFDWVGAFLGFTS
jgi:hypothetical protein